MDFMAHEFCEKKKTQKPHRNRGCIFQLRRLGRDSFSKRFLPAPRAYTSCDIQKIIFLSYFFIIKKRKNIIIDIKGYR
jgi:hypothetical protein